ncbi:MAG: hypothetical protein SWK76_02310 [Actinomycetota bacterium]|nr:hypothetical protein [Actinomycetota bacterium]
MSGRGPFVLACATAVIIVAVLLGGCGGEGRDPAETMSLAARNARDAGSVHAQMNITLAPEEGESGIGLNVQGDAWLDMAGEKLEARFTVMGMELSLRYVDKTAYLEWGGDWYYITAESIEGVGEGAVEAAVKVLVDYPDIFSSFSSVAETGEKEVGSFECTRYELVPDTEALLSLESVKALAGELGMTEDEIKAYIDNANVNMEVCIQKDEPVIREVYFAVDVDLPDVGELVGIPLLPSRARAEIQIAFPEYGMQVEVQSPPEAKPLQGIL